VDHPSSSVQAFLASSFVSFVNPAKRVVRVALQLMASILLSLKVEEHLSFCSLTDYADTFASYRRLFRG
jgi:hypothetical protein